ncbi:MAG: hypothetical protein ACI9P9_000675 [Patescibacteria group bacterium]|jgi:hypothetical protein
MKNSSLAYLITSLFYHIFVQLLSKKYICLFGLFILISFNSVKVISQPQDSIICEAYERPNPPLLGDTKEQIFVDRFGNYYLMSELSTWTENASLVDCNNDAFSLNFGNGFTIEQEETICEVFNYLSQIMGNPTPEFPANILVLREFLSGPTGATGSPIWDATCGIANSTIVEKILGGGQDISTSFPDGILRIDSDIPDNIWHTLADDISQTDPGLDINDVDLYSVTLHEALHILGFASRIGATGNPLDIYNSSGDLIIDNEAFSKWDTYLYSNINNEYLIESIPEPTLCCDEKVFIFNAFPMMPNPVDGNCSNGIVFNGNTVNQNVNNLVDLSSVDPDDLDFAVANKLSHIHRNCNNPQNEDFVMHPVILQGPDGVNRIISDTELNMMCDLGYPMDNICENHCAVVTQNDFIIRFNTSLSININNSILNNDILPPDYQLNIDLNCGNLPPGSYSYSGNGNWITMVNTPPPGFYYFCYTITGCNGEICDDGIVFLQHGVENCENQCNLFCLGDFEALLPVSASFFNQLGLDPFQFQEGNTYTPTPDVLYASPDNQLLGFYNGYGEPIYIPLTKTLEVGCTLDISFSASASLEDLTLQLFASQNPPCTNPSGPICQEDGFPSCIDYTLHCMTIPPNSTVDYPDGFPLVQNPTLNTALVFGSPDNVVPYPFDFNIGNISYFYELNLSNHSFEWVNMTGEPINYITILGGPLNLENAPYYFLDDLEIISSCDNQITVEPTIPNPACIGNINIIEYTVCHTGAGTETENVSLIVPELPNGITFGSGGDFINGETSITGLTSNGNCETVSLELVVSEIFVPGSIVTIPLTLETENACWADHGESAIDLNLEYCCDLPMEAGFVYSDCGLTVDFTSLTTDNSLSHAWDFTGDGNTESNSPNPSYTFISFGTYTVSHTVQNNCGDIASETLDITIVEDNTLDASFTYEDDICSFVVQFTSSEPSGDHQWIYNGNVFSTEANPSYDFLMAGTYQVTHILTVDCANAEETLSISTDIDECGVDENCECLSGVNITGPTTNITDVTNQSSINNTCVSVSGTLIINDDFSFNDCNIYMQPGAEIIINTNYVLDIYNSSISGCGEFLWQGITVQQKGTLNAQWNIISDAREAIQPLNGSKILLYYNTFDRNYVGIYTAPSIFGKTIFSTIYNNKFLCTDNLLHNYEEPDLGDRSFAGVWMNQTRGINIGQPNIPWNVNSFYGLRNGIIGVRSSVNIHHVKIEDLVGESTNLASLSGVGVFSDNSFLRLSRSDIMNGFTAVFTERTNIAQLDNCEIEGVQNGIGVFLGQQKINNITNNDIFCQNSGIFLSNLDNANLEVTNNVIHSLETPNQINLAGIVVSMSNFQEPADAVIEDNIIFLNNTLFGVLLNATEQVRVFNNTVNDVIPVTGFLGQFSAGININAGFENRIRDNTINGAGINSTMKGMRITSSMGTVFCCNTITNTKHGVFFSGECDDTKLRVTDVHEVETEGTGLFLHTSATLGDQTELDQDLGILLYGNIFSNQDGSVNSGATHEGVTEFQVNQSQFPINPTSFPETVPFPINSVSNQWFFIEQTGTTLTCASFPDCNIEILGLLPPGGGVDDRDIKTATGNNNFGIYSDGIQWEAARHLYRKMDNYTFLQQQNSSVDSFYSANQTSILGKMNEVQNATRALYIPDSGLWQTYEDHVLTTEELLAEIQFQDSLIFALPESQHEPVYLIKDSLTVLLSNNYDAIYELLDQMDDNRISQTSPIISFNASAPAPEVYESNLQIINDIYLQTIAQNSYAFSSSQLAQIEIIAEKCPLIDGNAVFLARGLLAMVKDTIFDDTSCLSVQYRSIEDESYADKITTFDNPIIYPNPASDEVVLKFPTVLEKPIQVSFYSITGQNVHTLRVPADIKEYRLDTSAFRSGIYLCKIFDGKNNPYTEKLIILK